MLYPPPPPPPPRLRRQKKPAGGDTRSPKKAKRQFPPPFPDLIYGYHANDVLNGRGATINVHPGNKQFRDLCAFRKEEFDSARNIQKREIALEIVQSVLEWNPPGRFLERANDSNNSNNANDNPEDDEVEAYFRAVDVDEVLTGSSAKYFTEKGLSTKKNKTLMRELGPWRDMGMERAIQKVCGVIRDHKRPDRIALKAMALLKVKNSDTTDSPSPDVETDEARDTLSINSKTKTDDDDDDTTGVVPTDNDVLLGRGAFINEHPGNRQFRTLALEHKAKFDGSSPADRRKISTKIVELTKDCTPPGRFLKRAPTALQEPILLPDGKYELPPRGLEGPWEEVADEQAHAKAIQVLRDLKTKAPAPTPSDDTPSSEETKKNEIEV